MSSQTLYHNDIMKGWHNGYQRHNGYQGLSTVASDDLIELSSVPISSSALHFDWRSWNMSWRAWHLCGQSLENVWGQKKRLISLIMSHICLIYVSSCLIMSYHSFRVERGHAMLEEPRLFSGSHSIILQQIAQQPINLYSRKSSRVKSH